MNYELHIATAPLFFHTACVCSEKNYRLQDIQLSKNPPSRSRASAKQARDFRRRTCYSHSRLALAEASHRAKPPGEAKAGGEYRARTGDLLVANQALSQLS